MGTVTMREEYHVTLQVDNCDGPRYRPRSVVFDSLDEAAAAIGRGLRLLPNEEVVAMVSRELVEGEDQQPDDPTLEGWPAERHVVTGPRTFEDF